MSLIADGRSALSAMLSNPTLFGKLKPADYSAIAVKLARKQVTAGGLTLQDQLALRQVLGDDVYEKTLDSLSAHQAKQLAKRIDKTAPDTVLKTGSTALSHIRDLLGGTSEPLASNHQVKSDSLLSDDSISLMETDSVVTKNRYFGRKSFRTGR